MARTGGLPLPTITDDRVIGEAVIQKSLRFRSGGSTYLNRTFGTNSSDTTKTISFWMKKSILGTYLIPFGTTVSGTIEGYIRINNDDTLQIEDRNASDGTSDGRRITAAKLRDVSSWYHIVLALDSTQGTESDRAKFYINGTQATISSSITITQNYSFQFFRSSAVNYIGVNGNSSNYFDGYLAEINFIDGQALDSSYFGFTDSQTGIWMPKRYEGTYGNNGFRLDFSDNSSTAALGIDKSPNGNDFTVNNHSVSANLTNDSMLDTPTNSFCTLNHLNKTTSFSGKDGGLTFDQTSNDQAITGTFFVTSGKWYWEFYKNSGHNPEIGISVVGRETLNNRSTGFIDGRVAFISNGGNLRTGSSSTASITGSSSGQTGAGWLRIACDMDNKKIWFSDLSGNYFNSGNPATGANPAYDFSSHEVATGWAPYICLTTANDANGYPNFGQFDLNSFSSNIPAGFKTLTAKNLRDELLTNPSIVRPKRHFDTLLYTGTGSSNIVEGLEFSPDMIWVKGRDTSGTEHAIIDTVRGGTKSVVPNSTDAESTHGGRSMTFYPGGVRWNSDSNICNANGENYALWCWKGGGSSNTFNVDGTGYATAAAAGITDGNVAITGASVNRKNGFSVVTYTGSTASGALTVGHGLNKKPAWVLIKRRDATSDWIIGHQGFATNAFENNKFLKFTNETIFTNSLVWGAEPTTTVTQIVSNGAGGAANLTSSGTYVMYSWAEIPGYSKFGKYEGNGNNNGTFVHTGFRPAFIIVKNLNTVKHWGMYDNKRAGYNVENYALFPSDASATEDTSDYIDILSNGFKLRSSALFQNKSGDTLIYIAFAEHPGVSPFTTMVNAR